MSFRLIIAAAFLTLVACSDDDKTPVVDMTSDALALDAAVNTLDAAQLSDASNGTADALAVPFFDALPSLACTIDEITPIVTCAIQNCAQNATDQAALIACITINCAGEFINLSPTCKTCVLSGFSLDPGTLQEACLQ